MSTKPRFFLYGYDHDPDFSPPSPDVSFETFSTIHTHSDSFIDTNIFFELNMLSYTKLAVLALAASTATVSVLSAPTPRYGNRLLEFTGRAFLISGFL